MSHDETITVDAVSLLVQVSAQTTLASLEQQLSERGFTLGVTLDDKHLPRRETTTSNDIPVGEWLAQGAPGSPSPFTDPADHLVAGLEATLADGTTLEIRPTPRRAVGPDLTALVMGAQGRLATVKRVWLRIHTRNARRPSLPLPGIDLDPPVTTEEMHLFGRIEQELRLHK